MSKEIYYVRGDTTVVMVRAKDPADAVRLSLEGGGDAGKVTVYSEIAWMGLEEGENLIIGFAS